ncbi:hypothetical protein QLX08_006396 [Tetragonisca angustula]|uniref:Uncharacterized protein n=1 Tax=Tetragonisca angustula TaxID=166442 RepID=A0AAW0ZTT1_9HYME
MDAPSTNEWARCSRQTTKPPSRTNVGVNGGIQRNGTRGSRPFGTPPRCFELEGSDRDEFLVCSPWMTNNEAFVTFTPEKIPMSSYREALSVF